MYISDSLQDQYLLELIKSHKPVMVYLINGKCHHGSIISLSKDLLFLHTPLLQTICRSHILSVIPLGS